MDLKELLSPELYEQVRAAIDAKNAGIADKTKHVRFADLSEGKYVDVGKYNDKVNTLAAQVTDLQGQITQRDTDISGLQDKLAAAQADASKLSEVQGELTGLQAKYAQDQQTWEANVARQRKEFMLRERAGTLRFSSEAAKRDFLGQATGKDFKLDGDTLMGYEDFLTKYREDNPGALVEEASEGGEKGSEGGSDTGKQPQIVLGNNGQSTGEKPVFGFHFNGVRPKPTE